MPDAAIQIMEKVDEAWKAWFDQEKGTDLQHTDAKGNVLDIPIEVAFDGNKLTLPRIEIAAASSEEDAESQYVGNHNVEWSIDVMTNGDRATRDDHKRWAGVVAAMIFRSDVEAGLSLVVADFTAMLLTRGIVDRAVDENTRLTTFNGELLCFPS